MDSQILNIVVSLSPLLLAVVLVLSNRPRYRMEIATERTVIKERDEAIVALHYCRESVAKMEQEIAGLRWMLSTYGVRPVSSLPPTALVDEPKDPNGQVRKHIMTAWEQEKANLAFLKEQVARYGDSDLTRHNQIEAVGKRIRELENILDGYPIG